MSADLYIHAFIGITEDDLREFSRNTLGSKYFDPVTAGNTDWDVHKRVSDTPNVWVGEVSWLKAALLEGGDKDFVPNTVATIHELIGEELPVLDDKLAQAILAAFDQPNSTGYSLADRRDVETWLSAYAGEKLFVVSW